MSPNVCLQLFEEYLFVTLHNRILKRLVCSLIAVHIWRHNCKSKVMLWIRAELENGFPNKCFFFPNWKFSTFSRTCFTPRKALGGHLNTDSNSFTIVSLYFSYTHSQTNSVFYTHICKLPHTHTHTGSIVENRSFDVEQMSRCKFYPICCSRLPMHTTLTTKVSQSWMTWKNELHTNTNTLKLIIR